MQSYKTEYKDYSKSVAIMISTDRLIFIEKSAVRNRMIEQSKLYKELHIIIFSNKKVEPSEISPNCKIYSTNSLLRWNYVSDACRVGKNILKKVEKTDPLLISCQDPFETALVGKCLVNLRKESELLLQIHTDLFSPYFIDSRLGFLNSFLNKVRLFISKFTLPHAQVIRVVSNKIADSLVKKGIDSEKIIVKPIDVNVDYIKNTSPSFDLHQKFPNFKKIILMVSRLEPEKNISLAINALKIIKAKIPDIGLVIVGSGKEMNKLKKQAYKLNLSQNVAFVGWQTDIIPYYKGCDVFLVTSLFEGYGMTFKEAEASGCKMVSTNVGIAREVGAEIVEWNKESVAEGVVKTLNLK